MRFGTIASTFPPIPDVSRTVKRIEEKGYDSVWFPDHLMGWYPHDLWRETPFALRYPSCHMFYDAFCSLCYVAPSTERIKLGVSVTEVFRRHPAVLLQQAVTANHASNGRFILGLGAGEAENIVPYGIEFKNPASRLEEALKLINIMLKSSYGEKIDFNGKFYKFKDAVFDIKPISKIPIWIGAHGDKMLEITAKYADGWIPVNMPLDIYRGKLKKLELYAKREGRDPSEIEKAMFTHLVIDERKEDVENLLEKPTLKIYALLMSSELYEMLGYKHPFGRFYGLTDYIPTRYTKEQIISALEKIPTEVVRKAFIYGTVEDIVQELDKYANIGVEHIVIWNLTYFGDPSKIKSSYNLIDEVVKHFKS